jgi:dihydrofolate reductase
MKLSIIVAMSPERVIGIENRLPWSLPSDLRHFKKLTMGHHLLMGRRTYESIGRPLPGRTIIVVTRKQNYAPPGVLVAGSLQQALEKVGREEQELFVAGGAQIYRQTLPQADRLYVTLVDGDFPGDTHFPEIDPSQWILVSEKKRPPDDRNPYSCRFQTFDRKRIGKQKKPIGKSGQI